MSLEKWVTPSFPIKIHKREYGAASSKKYPKQFQGQKEAR